MSKLTSAQLAAVFGMSPTGAVAYLEQKGLRITGNWHDMLNEDHAEAFTVANCAKLDVLRDLHQAAIKAVKLGTTEREFIKNLIPTLQSKGWWGKSTDDEGNVTQLGSVRRLQTIYRTNLQSAYMAGRYREMVEGVASHPYWKYIAILDGRTRPSHGSMNGRIFKWDDPVWQFAYPPNGYNCRCRVVAVSSHNVKKNNLTVEDSTGRITKKEVPLGKDADGNMLYTDVMGIKLPTTGDKFITLYTDAGFDVNQGMAATTHAARIFADKMAKADPRLGAVAMQAAQTWLLPSLTREYQMWAQGLLASKQARNGARVIGAMSPSVLEQLQAMQFHPASAAITLRDTEFLHLYRDDKVSRGDALQAKELFDLPNLLANAKAVLWDSSDQALVYLLETEQAKKVIIRVDYKQKQNINGVRDKALVNSVRTAGAADVGDLRQYTLLQGRLD